jgi:hypothetical protein
MAGTGRAYMSSKCRIDAATPWLMSNTATSSLDVKSLKASSIATWVVSAGQAEHRASTHDE